MRQKVEIDTSFHMVIAKKTPTEETEAYRGYRRRWSENPKNNVVEAFPIHLDIESTSACNLKCFMCFQSFRPPEKGYMDWELYKKIVDEGAKKGLCSIKLMYRGEPLLHPRIVDMVKYAKEKGILEVMFNTNATLLDEKKARALIAAGLDKLICSVDGCTKEVYESVRIGADFDTVLKNIKTLQKLKKEMKSATPVLRIQMVDTPKNHSQVQEYVKFWGKIADNVAVEDMCDWTDAHEDTLVLDFVCAQLWQRLIVLWDGRVLPCCGDRFAQIVLGDAKKESISDIWRGIGMQHLRELHLAGKSHEMKICRFCDLRKIATNTGE